MTNLTYIIILEDGKHVPCDNCQRIYKFAIVDTLAYDADYPEGLHISHVCSDHLETSYKRVSDPNAQR